MIKICDIYISGKATVKLGNIPQFKKYKKGGRQSVTDYCDCRARSVQTS